MSTEIKTKIVWCNKSVGGACTSGTSNVLQDTGSNTAGWKFGTTLGQSFQVVSNGYLYSIKFKTGSTLVPGKTITCRVGTGADLTTYSDSGSVVITASSTWYEFHMTNHMAVSIGTTYYFGTRQEDTSDNDMYYSNTSVYASGTMWESDGADWTMDVQQSGQDLVFEIFLCAD